MKIHEPDKTADALLKKVAFNTSMTSGFPLEMFNVTAVLRDEANPDAAREYDEFMLQQNGRQLQIAKALFVVTQIGIKEDQPIGTYANWQQVAAAINSINDAKNKYQIQVLDDTVTIDGTFTIPSKATSLEYTDLVWKCKPSNQCDIPEFLVDAESNSKRRCSSSERCIEPEYILSGKFRRCIYQCNRIRQFGMADCNRR